MSAQLHKDYEAELDRMFWEKVATQPVELRGIAKSGGTCCKQEDEGYICSLEKGHVCDHAAYGRLGYIHHQWPIEQLQS
jgi:hypothetical protein